MIGNKNKALLGCCLFLIFFGLCILLTGCETPEPPQNADRSFVTGQPCTAPCWYGIVPDKSTESEALEKLQELPFVDHAKIKEDKNVGVFIYPNTTKITFYYVSPSGTRCGLFVIMAGIVKDIYLDIRYPLQLKSAVNQLGQPGYIWYAPASPNGGGCEVFFHWPQKGIVLNTLSGQGCSFLDKGMPPDLQIDNVQYQSQEWETAARATCANFDCISWPGFSNK
jgi:hypothetical protein